MTLEHRCREALARFEHAKVATCSKHRGPADLKAMLDATFRHKRESRVMLLSGNPHEYLPTALDTLCSESVPEIVILLADGYARPEGVPDNYRHGQLAEDFKVNPLSSVLEILSAEGINTLTGNQYQIVVPYSYGADGLPVFGSHHSSNKHSGMHFGEMLAEWYTGIKASRRRKKR